MTKKFETVVLHVGADKTGSTSIQACLDRGRDGLIESGLLAYPPRQNHGQLASVFASNPEEFVYNKVLGNANTALIKSRDAAYLQSLVKWLNAVKPCKVLVLSYEGFVSLDEAGMVRLRDFCLEYADRVEVVMYARAPLSYAVSAISQRVKMGRAAWPDNLPPVFKLKVVLERLIGVFGLSNCAVRKFDRAALKNGDVIQDFLAPLGLSEEVVAGLVHELPRENEKLTETGLRMAEATAQALKSHGLEISRNEFNSRYGKHFSLASGAPIRLTAEQIRVIQAESEENTTILRGQFGIEFAEDTASYLRPEVAEAVPAAFFQDVGEVLAGIVVDFYKITHATGRVECADVVQVGDQNKIHLPVRLFNASREAWVSSRDYPVRLGVRFLEKSGRHFKGERKVPLGAKVLQANASQELVVQVAVPAAPRVVAMELVLFQENVGWMDKRGFTAKVVKLQR